MVYLTTDRNCKCLVSPCVGVSAVCTVPCFSLARTDGKTKYDSILQIPKVMSMFKLMDI